MSKSIRLVIRPTDEDMVDDNDDTGLTNDAYLTLMNALSNAGFEVEEGPEA